MAAPSDRVIISDLPAGMDQATVTSIFGAYGNIKTVRLIPGKNAAIVQFQILEEAVWVVENLDGNIAQDLTEPVSCRYAPAAQEGGKAAAAPVAGKGPYSGGAAATGAGAWANGGMKGGIQPACQGGAWGAMQGGKAGSVQILKKGLQNANVLPGGKWTNDENALFISGLPSDTTDLDLYEIFSPFGAIPTKGVRAMSAEDGTCKGHGFVNFLTNDATTKAIQTLNGTIMPSGTTLTVRVMGRKAAGPGVGAAKAPGK